MKFATGLTAAARAELVEFVATHTETADPARFANAMEDGHDWSANATLEIGGHYTRSKNPVTISFHDNDLTWEEIED